MEFFMKANLFSGSKSRPLPDLSREEFMAMLESIGKAAVR